MTTALATPGRLAVSPYAKRLARERGISLADLAGSGPGGRIVAADVAAFVPAPARAPVMTGAAQTSTLATTIDLTTVRVLLAAPGAGSPFVLDDLVLRAAACALDDVVATALPGAPVALESRVQGRRSQLVFTDVRKVSLGALRTRRLEALASERDDSGEPAALSLRLIEASDIRPVSMPLLGARTMRMLFIAGGESAECLLAFDETVDDEAAIGLLVRLKAYLETPILLLA